MLFKVICSKCNSTNVDINKSIDGLCFECMDCGLKVNMVSVGIDENGVTMYDEEIISESKCG